MNFKNVSQWVSLEEPGAKSRCHPKGVAPQSTETNTYNTLNNIAQKYVKGIPTAEHP